VGDRGPEEPDDRGEDEERRRNRHGADVSGHK
jgi:hypothetical protein